MTAPVAIVMGSQSDWPTMRRAAEALDKLEVPYEARIVSAHGNSLRALVKHLSRISDADIAELEIPTGEPIVYDFDDAMVPGERHYLKDR